PTELYTLSLHDALPIYVQEFNGNDLAETIKSLENAKALARREKPVLNVMNTVMGKGVDFMEGSHKWHGIAPDDAQLEQALAQLEDRKSTRLNSSHVKIS